MLLPSLSWRIPLACSLTFLRYFPISPLRLLRLPTISAGRNRPWEICCSHRDSCSEVAFAVSPIRLFRTLSHRQVGERRPPLVFFDGTRHWISQETRLPSQTRSCGMLSSFPL